MFNGYNETPLISYEFNQDRADKKQENAPKWSYGHEAGVHQAQCHPNSRQAEFWPPKPGFVGLPNVVKCSCTSCYPSSENQSYQGETTRHRPWLPRTFPVPLNGSNEPCKLPAYQWDSASLNQSSCYPDTNAPFVQENGGKHAFYRHYQESRLPEPNQPSVITSLKNTDFGKKQKEETSHTTLQNGVRQPAFCNPIYNLAKRTDGRNYCDPNEKYSNAAPFPVDQHVPRLPVVEPYINAVPSNLSQNRVPSTGYRSVKENVSQSYLDAGYNDSRKMCPEPNIGNDKTNECFPSGALPPGAHIDYSHFGRDLPEAEPQKLFLDNTRHCDYYSRKNFQDVINKNNQILDNRKDCVITQINQMNLSEQYNVARSKYQETEKLSCEKYYTKDFDKMRTESRLPENPMCLQRNEDKNENVNVHARLTRPALIFTDPRFADRTQNSVPYQNNSAYRNHARPEYPYQGYNAHQRFECPVGFQRNDFGQYRAAPQQMQTCEQFIPQPGNGFSYDSQCQQNTDKTAQFFGEKTSSYQLDSIPPSVEAIRSEGLNKNGTSKISPLRLLRKKKFINVPHEPSPSASTLNAPSGLDVRKFWSTWAEEEEENLPSTQMVVLDCQNIDPEQAKLLNLYDTDPVRAVQLESGSIVLKNAKEPETLSLEEIAAPEEPVAAENDAVPDSELIKNQKENNNIAEKISATPGEPENTPTTVEPIVSMTSPSKSKIGKGSRDNRGGKKSEVMDKWTEKKFDFLKRAEESKAAKILRHEEEKKKIFETRLSLQQSLKKTEKNVEKITNNSENKIGSMSPFDENSQNSSPDDEDGDVSNLPTSEYRRNKFLDYSDRKVIVNGKGKNEKNVTEDEDIFPTKISATDEIKNESVKVEKMNSTDQLPSVNAKLKDEPLFQVDDILQQMSEINFHSKEVKLENGMRDVIPKKSRGALKKMKRKKSDHQTEDQRTDKVTLETVKFSIQKSHDLKISFKVLNNTKKCSDEELGSKDGILEGNPLEDPKNSTELITLKYKSIQRDGDRVSESKKNKRRFRRKKNATHEKTPVLKIKKSRYLPPSERDPLGTYEDENDCDFAKKPYSDDYSTSNDFHVHETVDSAKIKLTFKRHKTNFETQYEINNSNGIGSDPTKMMPMCEDEPEGKMLKSKCRKKSKRMKEDEIFAVPGVESFQNSPDNNFDSDAESTSKENALASTVEEFAKTPIASHYFYSEEEENDVFESATEVAPTLDDGLCDNNEIAVESDRENSTHSEEKVRDPEKNSENQLEEMVNVVSDRNEANEFTSPKYSQEFTLGETEDGRKERNFEKEEIQEISLDFIRSANSPEIETDHKPEKTEGNDAPGEENSVETPFESESFRNPIINHSEIQESSYESDSEKIKSDIEKPRTENTTEWKETSIDGVIGIEAEDCGNEIDSPEEVRASLSPLFSDAHTEENCLAFERPNEILPDIIEENVNPSPLEHEISEDFDLSSIGGPSDENHSENDFKSLSDEFPLASETSKEAYVDEEPNKSANECRKGSSQLQYESAKDDQLYLGENKSFECESVLCLQMSPEDTTSEEVRLSPERTNSEEFPPRPEAICDKVVEMSIDEIKFRETQLSAKIINTEEVEINFGKTNHEKVQLSPKRTNNRTVELSQEETCFEKAQRNSGKIYSREAEMTMEGTNTKETEKISKESNSEATLREDSCLLKNGASQKEAFGVACAGDYSFKEKISCATSERTFEEIGQASVYQAPDCSNYNFSFGTNATITKVKNNSSIGMKKEKKTDRVTDVLETTEALLTKTSKNDSIDSLTFQCTESFENCHSQSGHTQSHCDLSDSELEEGEIVDSPAGKENSFDAEENPMAKLSTLDNKKVQRKFEFIDRKIQRRNSTESVSGSEKGSQFSALWRKKFSRLKSCPPELRFPENECKELGVPLNVAVECIPLPFGPPPHYSCLDFKNYNIIIRLKSNHTEAKEKPKESISPEPLEVTQKEFHCGSPVKTSDLQNSQNPVCDANALPQLGILNRCTKIKFSFSKRSKFSKINLANRNPNLDVFSQSNEPSKELKNEEPTTTKVEITKTDEVDCERSVTPAECQSEEVPNANVANETEKPKNNVEESKEQDNDSETPVELLGEDLAENIEVIGTMSDYMRDEFYECEDIPTSEDLTNGDDLEMEKVNDDKFRNIMQNCLDNAKKFLNVGNLKLFSCSVDDLLELDCQAPESALEEQEQEQEPHPNHISRDVLLTSCEDTNDDLGLSENTQPPDLSMEFVPSFCSDVCPEILPVDNWPYLEEEVPSSPTRTKQDESDLIPPLETSSSNTFLTSAGFHPQSYPKNGVDRRKLLGETCFKRFRRKSLMSDGEAIRICSKIGPRRRNTVNTLSGYSCEKVIRDIKSELTRWGNVEDDVEKQSLKCRLSLEKLKDKHGINFNFQSERMRRTSEDSPRAENEVKKKNGKSVDFKSPTWQPKVMLLRISKNELKKARKESKHRMRSESKPAENLKKKEVSSEIEYQDVPAVKKPRQGSNEEKGYKMVEHENREVDLVGEREDRLVGLSGLESVKGSLKVIAPTDERRRKKLRFRNLHTKRKGENGEASAQTSSPIDPEMVENALTDMFKDIDRVLNSQAKSTKETSKIDGIGGKVSNESHISAKDETFMLKNEGRYEKSSHGHREEHKHREKRKEVSHRERRKEEVEQHKHRERRKEDDGGRTRHSHHQKRSKHSPRLSTNEPSDESKCRSRNRSRSNSGGDTPKGRRDDRDPEDSWFCEVCGFDDAKERVAHIKNHPFHCQSCHLAFKTEVYFVNHLTKKHKNIRNQHHCLLCELSFDTEDLYQKHLVTREHRHLESVEKNTINTLFTLLTGAPCPVLGLVEMKPEWLPNQAGTVHFYHQATPLSLALQVLPASS